ncbi:hypothetical protein ASF21_12825 [Arthrobacter sp. Leaf234]|uniref:hypothetical protein n=1 Tax=Arthrobacter sp. Leaf234 TaxID=1736303 RepID=UPI0006FC2A75|nr:hypothetical protein [Arthrobacter sp. Leaf234]KQN99685.1 hypothetical protein ASF21_12825 [Arthrobacter sp. Leaf234]
MNHTEGLLAAITAATDAYLEESLQAALAPLQADITRLKQQVRDEQANTTTVTGQRDDAAQQLVAARAELDQAKARILELTKPTPPPAAPAAPVQPTGVHSSGVPIVRLQDLGVTLDGAGLRAALAKDQGGRIISAPPGLVAEARDFPYGNGVFWVHNGVGGLIGTPGAPLELGIVPGSSTKAAQVAALPANSTNPFYILVANDSARGDFVFSDIHWRESKAGHLHGGAQIRTNKGRAESDRITGAGFAPGDKWFPPGETFGLNYWRCASVEATDIDLAGNGVCSSLIGFNNVASTRLIRATLRDSPYGMPTWWQCGDVYTEDLVSIGGHAGINHERVGGKVHHVRPTVRPDRAKYRNAMHFTFNSDQDAYKGTLLIEDPIHNDGIDAGRIMVHIDDVYNGVPNKITPASVTIRKGGRTLVGVDTSIGGTKPAPDRDGNYLIYR